MGLIVNGYFLSSLGVTNLIVNPFFIGPISIQAPIHNIPTIDDQTSLPWISGNMHPQINIMI